MTSIACSKDVWSSSQAVVHWKIAQFASKRATAWDHHSSTKTWDCWRRSGPVIWLTVLLRRDLRVAISPALVGLEEIGRSLNLLLRERLLGIIILRLKHGFSWTGGEIFLFCHMVSHKDCWRRSGPVIWLTVLLRRDLRVAISVADHMTELDRSIATMSLPLLAMQFTLRHFVKCTTTTRWSRHMASATRKYHQSCSDKPGRTLCI
jgi:hypothetical protein